MVAARNGLLMLAWDALVAWWRRAAEEGVCASCGAEADPALDECLRCLGARHW